MQHDARIILYGVGATADACLSGNLAGISVTEAREVPNRPNRRMQSGRLVGSLRLTSFPGLHKPTRALICAWTSA